MGRVIVVSNRVPDPLKAAHAGGMVVGISDCLIRRGGIWFGWSGAIEDDASTNTPTEMEENGVLRVTVPVSEREYNGYYLGYSNSVLWPVFHNRIDLAQFEAGYFAIYNAVNERFADLLQQILADDDVIWVHDYHLIPLAQKLRAIGINNRIGFFLHIPFPPSQAFMAIPEHELLAKAFSAYDLVGLQSTTDVAHMIDYLEHGASGQLLPDGRMRVAGREFSIASFPVGIDVSYFARAAEEAAEEAPGGALARIVGVDRLDYTKGLPQKFRAYGRFLDQYPSFRGRVVLTQIAAPTRESVEAYSDIRKELETLTGAINGAYGDLEWVPIHYINRAESRERLAGVYRHSAVGLVTPLRDGMNLVAKEFVAAQDVRDPGVLILSRFAGAAEQLTDALLVNPYNIEDISEAIRAAVDMPLAERVRRHQALLAKIARSDASNWSESFLAQLTSSEVALRSGPKGERRLLRAIKTLSDSEKFIRPPFRSSDARSGNDRIATSDCS